MVDLVSLDIKSKFATSGTNKLTGGVGSRITATFGFIVHLEVVNADLGFGDGTNAIYSNNALNFISAGFKVGMVIEVVTATTTNDGTYIISGVTSNTIFVVPYASGSGSGSSGVEFTEEITLVGSIHDTTPVSSVDYYFGLVKNGEGAAYLSLFDGEEQHYRKTELNASSLNTYSLDVFSTNKSWVTGSVSEQALTTITEKGIGTSGASYGYEQYFEITHTFHINPSVARAWEDANGDLSQALIDWLAAGASIYFVPKVVAGWEPGGSEHTTDSGNINAWVQSGDVGYYGEYRNGGTPNYSISTPAVFESSSGDELNIISWNDDTTVTFRIEKSTGSFNSNHRFDLYLMVVPDDAAAQNNVNTVWQNYDVSNVFLTEGAMAVSDNKILNASVDSIDSNHVEVTFDVDGSASMEGKKYLIRVDIGDTTITSQALNDHHQLEVAYNEFQKYIDTDGLFVTNGILINEHSNNEESLANTDYKGWIEDGLLATYYFDISKQTGIDDQYDAYIDNVEFSIDVEHQIDSTRNFNLEKFNIPLPSNTTRGFQLYSGDPKNYKILSELTGDADYRKYLLQVATKLRWEEWSLLGNADPDFINATNNWSDYDFPPDWKVVLNINTTVNLTNTDDENDTEVFMHTQKVDIGIKNYEEYIGCEKHGLIETFHSVTGQNLNGKLAPNANTLVKATFTGKSLFPCIYQNITSGSGECEFDQIKSGSGSFEVLEGDVDDCPFYYGILEINQPVAGNPTNIRQISTLYDTEAGSPWIGPVSTNKAAIITYPYASPPRIEVYATLDQSALSQSVNYYVSGRLGRGAQTICDASIMGFVADTNTFSDTAINGFTESDLLVFVGAKERIVMGQVISVVGSTITFTGSFSDAIKVVCAKDIIEDTTSDDNYQNNDLIGLSINDFLFFTGNDGLELTSKSGTIFTSGTGTIQPTGNPVDIRISFHEALISTSVSSATSYSNNALIGLSEIDVMIFVNGIEYTHLGATISGNTITFPFSVTGPLKVCKVNQ